MKSTPITRKAAASPLKQVGPTSSSSSNKSSSSSTSYEADASGNVFKVDRTQTAGDVLAASSSPSNVPQARGGARAANADAYIAGLKKRFPDATGQDLKDKGYISDAYVGQFPAAQSSATSTESSSSETRTPVMRPAEPGNKGMETDTRWNWQQKNINRTQNSQERQNRREARKDMKYLESEGLVQRTGKLGRGQGWALTEAGAADENAQTMFKANKRDIFGADRQRFRTDSDGNVTGRSEAYDVQDSRKNRAQTGSYDPNDNYREARPEEQWNVNKHGEYGSGTTSSSSSSDQRASSTDMFQQAEPTNVPAKDPTMPVVEQSMPSVQPQKNVEDITYSGQLDEVEVTAPSRVGVPTYKSHGSLEVDMSALQMKYKHNPRMMYGDSPAKMWGAAKAEAQSKIVGNFKSSTAGKPITKAASGPFKMKGYKK